MFHEEGVSILPRVKEWGGGGFVGLEKTPQKMERSCRRLPRAPRGPEPAASYSESEPERSSGTRSVSSRGTSVPSGLTPIGRITFCLWTQKGIA